MAKCRTKNLNDNLPIHLYRGLLINFASRPHRRRRVVPSGRLFLKSGCNSDIREPASEQVFRRDQWAPCTHVRASQCDINIAIIIYVLSLHPRWDAQNKPTRIHPLPPQPCTCVYRRAPSTGCDQEKKCIFSLHRKIRHH